MSTPTFSVLPPPLYIYIYISLMQPVNNQENSLKLVLWYFFSGAFGHIRRHFLCSIKLITPTHLCTAAMMDNTHSSSLAALFILHFNVGIGSVASLKYLLYSPLRRNGAFLSSNADGIQLYNY